MNTKNIPGFTAGESLYKTSGRYQMTSSTHRVEQLNANSVQPSLAIYIDGRYVCDGEVTANGFINCYPIGGGGEDSGRIDRACRIQCMQNCLSEPLAQRADCRADCSELCMT